MQDFVIGLLALIAGLLLYLFLYGYYWKRSDKNLEQKRAELSTLLCEKVGLTYEEAIEIVTKMDLSTLKKAIKGLSKVKDDPVELEN